MDEESPVFDWQIIKCAVRGTLSMFEAGPRSILLALSILAVGPAWQLYFKGAQAMMENIVGVAKDSVVPTLVVGAILFLWNLWLAPTKLLRQSILEQTPYGGYGIGIVPSKQVNWNLWKQMPRYNVIELSRILAKLDPAGGPLSSECAGIQRLLFQDLNDKKLTYSAQYNIIGTQRVERQPDIQTEIPRASALKWARERKLDASHIE